MVFSAHHNVRVIRGMPMTNAKYSAVCTSPSSISHTNRDSNEDSGSQSLSEPHMPTAERTTVSNCTVESPGMRLATASTASNKKRASVESTVFNDGSSLGAVVSSREMTSTREDEMGTSAAGGELATVM